MPTAIIDNTKNNGKSITVNFVAGGIALSTAVGIMHPLETFKTRLQANNGYSPNIFNGLFRGFFVSSVGALVQGGLRLSTYEYTKSTLLSLLQKNNNDRDDIEYSMAAVSGLSAIVGDTVSSIVKVPREVITSRIQSSTTNINARYTTTHNLAYSTFKDIIRNEGFFGLYKGFASITARDWPFMVFLFVSYENLKQVKIQFGDSNKSLVKNDDSNGKLLESTLIGGISGGLAGFFTTPFDVIRTKIIIANSNNNNNNNNLNSSSSSTTSKSKSNGILSTSLNILKSRSGIIQSASGFFIGGASRTIWWVCVCSIFFPLYETIKKELHSCNHFNQINVKKIGF